MGRKTPVWVSHYGDAASTTIIGLVDESYQLVLLTGYTQ